MDLVDSPFGLLSCWVNVEEYNTLTWYLVDSDALIAWIVRGTGNGEVQLFFNGLEFETDGANINGSLFFGKSWRHVLCSWNLSGPSFEGHIYVDDILYPNFLTGTYIPGTLRWSLSRKLRFLRRVSAPFGGSFSDNFGGCIAQLYLNTQEYLDLTIVSNRRKFYDPNGRVVDLGENGELPTGNPPSFYFTGRTSNYPIFGMNRGASTIPFDLDLPSDCIQYPPVTVVVPDAMQLFGSISTPTLIHLISAIPSPSYSNGGSTLLKYKVYSDVGNVIPTTLISSSGDASYGNLNASFPVNATTLTVSGYSFAISVTNLAGDSALSNVVFLQN